MNTNNYYENVFNHSLRIKCCILLASLFSFPFSLCPCSSWFIFSHSFTSHHPLRNSKSLGGQECSCRWGTAGSSWVVAVAQSGGSRRNGAGWSGTGGTGWALWQGPARTGRGHPGFCHQKTRAGYWCESGWDQTRATNCNSTTWVRVVLEWLSCL